MTNAVAIAQSGSNNVTFRNRVINGDMRIDQRNGGASVTPTTSSVAFPVDRWAAPVSQSSKFSVQQNAGGVTAPAGFSNYLGVTSLSAYSVIASDYFALWQPIEGFNCADFAWGTASAQAVIVSFWVRSSLTGTFGGAVENSAQTRAYPFSYTISAANTWEHKTVTIPGDTSGTWLTNNGVGLYLIFGLGAGSTFSGTAGAWTGSQRLSATGAVSVVGTNGATFYITGVQLEAGSVATPFERRPYGTELALCQRYYQRHQYFKMSGVTGTGGVVINRLGGVLPVTMRSSPTVATQGAIQLFNGSGTSSFTGAALAYSAPNTIEIDSNTLTTTYSVNQPAVTFVGGDWYVTASAEL